MLKQCEHIVTIALGVIAASIILLNTVFWPNPEVKLQGDIVKIEFGNNSGRVSKDHLKVLFGSTKAHIIQVTNTAVLCQVPRSNFEGIGWDVKVKISVCDTFKCVATEPPTWTYPATNPSTKVANIGVLWITDAKYVVPRVLQLFVDRLGPDWRYQFFVFPRAMDFVKRIPIVQRLLAEGRLVIVEQKPVERHVYATLNIDPAYWESIQGDRILVFQADSVPCSGSKHNITEFFKYDYVGAPWASKPIGGNGGLSLRNRTALIRMLKDQETAAAELRQQQSFLMEDVAIANMSRKTAYFRMAPREAAKHFSVEQVYYDTPWGVHQVWVTLKRRPKQLQALQKTCPEIDIIKPETQ